MQLSESKSTGSKKLYTGIFSATVKAVNPDKEELAELIGYELKENANEQKYEDTDKDGNEVVIISFWEQTPEKQWFNSRFRITDKICTNKDGTKTQYVNQLGDATYVDDEKNLPNWFKHFTDKDNNIIGDKYVRKALIGEANLYNFIKSWLGKVDWFSADTKILIDDMKKLFRNVDKYVADEYKTLLPGTDNAKYTDDIVALAVIYTGEKDDKIVHYQNVYGEYLPAKIKDGSRYNVNTLSLINMSVNSNNWSNPRLKKWLAQLESEFGCKDAYTVGSLTEFNPELHQQSGNTTLKQEGDVSNSSPAIDTSY